MDRNAGDACTGHLGRHDADERAHVRVQRGAVVRDELDADRVGAGGQRERERLDVSEESNELRVEEDLSVTFLRRPDLSHPARLDECEVRHEEVDEGGSAVPDHGSVGRGDDCQCRRCCSHWGTGNRNKQQAGQHNQGHSGRAPRRPLLRRVAGLPRPHAFFLLMRADSVANSLWAQPRENKTKKIAPARMTWGIWTYGLMSTISANWVRNGN